MKRYKYEILSGFTGTTFTGNSYYYRVTNGGNTWAMTISSGGVIGGVTAC